MITAKITPGRHLSRMACVYIRQSTAAQVRFNQESTERQYNLASKAQSLGWSPQQIRVLDRDLGQSGARTTNREDFKSLVSDVAMGNVGAIFSLEASRLARSNQDWHRLLELCAITNTLVIDEDGCYDPAEFNDGLVLGMKGTFAQAELHIIRTRLHGGKLNKAQRGELRFPLPVGFVHDGSSIALDPDLEVQGAVRTVFELFEKEGTAYAVVRRFNDLGLRLRRRLHLRTLSVVQAYRANGRDRHDLAADAAGELARHDSRSSSRLHHLGPLPRQPSSPGGKPDKRRGAWRPGARRALPAPGNARVRQVRPAAQRALYGQWRSLSNLSLQLA